MELTGERVGRVRNLSELEGKESATRVSRQEIRRSEGIVPKGKSHWWRRLSHAEDQVISNIWRALINGDISLFRFFTARRLSKYAHALPSPRASNCNSCSLLNLCDDESSTQFYHEFVTFRYVQCFGYVKGTNQKPLAIVEKRENLVSVLENVRKCVIGRKLIR